MRMARVILGFGVGVAATVPMTAIFLIERDRGLIDEIPPRKIVRSVARTLHEPKLSAASAITHLLIGGASGALYGATMPPRRSGALSGALFGILLWAIGYEAVMPAATGLPPAHRDDRARAISIFVAHIVFGTALGLVMSLPSKRGKH